MRGKKMKGQVWAACLVNRPRLLGRELLLSYTGVPGHAHIKLPSSIKCRVVAYQAHVVMLKNESPAIPAAKKKHCGQTNYK